MTGAHTERVEELFYGALALEDAGERAAFLERACAGNGALRAAVEQMLAEQPEADTFFTEDNPVQAVGGELLQELTEPGTLEKVVASEPSLDDVLGTQVGPYKVLGKLGEGGCGSVYRAEQEEPIRRQVALKVIKLGMDTRNVITRFRAEQQALEPMVQLAQKSLGNADFSPTNSSWQIPWRCLSLALWEYRVGNFSEAIVWSHRCLDTGYPQASRTVSARAILAMALHRLGEGEASRSELGQVRGPIEQKFKESLELGNTPDGYWFDWLLARILLREATDLEGHAPGPAN